MALKGYTGNLDEIISKHESKNNIQVKLDDLKNKKNVLSKEIGTLAQKGESIDEQKNNQKSYQMKFKFYKRNLMS